MINEGIQPCRRVDVDLAGRAVEIMLQTAARLVFRIEIQKRKRNLVGLEPFGQRQHATGLPYPAFPPHGEDHSFCLWFRIGADAFLAGLGPAHGLPSCLVPGVSFNGSFALYSNRGFCGFSCGRGGFSASIRFMTSTSLPAATPPTVGAIPNTVAVTGGSSTWGRGCRRLARTWMKA